MRDSTLCTKCSICYSACPAAIDERFLGPSTYATNYRFISDSRDEGSDERLKVITDNVWLCPSCNSCTLFRPKEIDLSSAIVEERSLLVEAGIIQRTVKDVLTNTFKYHNPMHQSGGGAGRVWTEEATPEKRPSVNRVREALELDIEVIATACPFCVTTLEDAVKALDAEDKIVVRDILELLKEAV